MLYVVPSDGSSIQVAARGATSLYNQDPSTPIVLSPRSSFPANESVILLPGTILPWSLNTCFAKTGTQGASPTLWTIPGIVASVGQITIVPTGTTFIPTTFVASGILIPGPGNYVGFDVENTSLSNRATIRFHNGTDNTGQVIDRVTLKPGQSARECYPFGFKFKELYLELVSGTVAGESRTF